MIEPDWPAAPRVRALVTTRAMGDMAGAGRNTLKGLVPGEPAWLTQVHGTTVIDLDEERTSTKGDAAITRSPGTVCVVGAADCMPVLLTDQSGSVVAAAHAGWRGLGAGVIEAAIGAMGTPPGKILAWLGPAIGPRAYEVGEDVKAAFAAFPEAFSAPTRPGHWRLDLYAVARTKLRNAGVRSVYGGGFCTYTDPALFYSFRRDKTKERMAALIWLT